MNLCYQCAWKVKKNEDDADEKYKLLRKESDSLCSDIGTKSNLQKKIDVKYGTEEEHLENLNEFQLQSLQFVNYGTFAVIGKGCSVKYEVDVAVKIVNLKNKRNKLYRKQYLPHEVKLWRKLSQEKHENILLLKDDMKISKYKYMLMEYVASGNLHEFLMLHPVGERLGKTIFSQMVAAVDYCHDNGIAHRDIKPANFLIGWSKCIKLAGR